MNCYNHPETPAVGVCVSCNKGTCKQCTNDNRKELTCHFCSTFDSTKPRANGTHSYERKSYARPAFTLLLGLIYTISFPIISNKPDYLMMALGLLFTAYGGYQVYIVYHINNKSKGDDLLDE